MVENALFVRDGKVHSGFAQKEQSDDRFPELREIGKVIKAKAALIDGEVVALGEDGLPQFDALRFRRGRKCSIVFYAFDLLHLDGFDLTSCPLIKRKELLKRILPKDNTGRIRFTDHIAGKGERLFEKLRGSESRRHGDETEGQRLRILPLPRLVEGQDGCRKDDNAEAHRNLELKNNLPIRTLKSLSASIQQNNLGTTSWNDIR
jgi:hypothetical protein